MTDEAFGEDAEAGSGTEKTKSSEESNKARTGAGSKSSDARVAFWTAIAAIVAAVANSGITLVGWTSAEAIKKKEVEAQTRLASIELVADKGYLLYARAVERDFIELYANSPGIEVPGAQTEIVKRTIREYKETLEKLEEKIPPAKRQQTRILLEVYLTLTDARCSRDAIAKLQGYSEDKPIKIAMLANAYQQCDDPEKAIELNGRIRAIPIMRPNDRIKAKSLNNVGDAYVGKGSAFYAFALENYNLALKSDPTLYGVYYSRAALYARWGQSRAAIGDLCDYKKRHDGNVIDEISIDRHHDFDRLIKDLGPVALAQMIGGCDKAK